MTRAEVDRDLPVVAARGVYMIYRETTVETVALRGADLDLAAGTWTSLMGPSGSGKTTMLHAMAGLLEPSGGSVTLDEVDLTRLPERERAAFRRRRVGLVLQQDNLHPLLDVAGNIALPLRLDGWSGRRCRPRVTELLDEVGVAHRRHAHRATLSGGEAQRVAVAVALALRPPVLLADEPTGELDPGTAAGVLDLLGRVCHDDGVALLTVTHNPAVAERADRRLRMRDGLVAEDVDRG